MGWRRVVEFGILTVLLVAAGCGGSSARPDATGAGGIGVGGNGATAISREYSVSLINQRKVDFLFLIDDSSSMAAAQATLRQSFGRFVAALRAAPGGLPDLHIAVVSSDMGAGDASISTCDSTGGKQGIFQYTARGTCTSTGLQSGATFISDAGGVKNYTGNLEDVLGCIAPLGEAGCGFEHQFAAIIRALGVDGLGAPPAENQGFLRPDAYLVVILLTNEDDCSASLGNGPNNRIPLFDTSANTNMASQLGPPQNFRCNEFGHTCPTGVVGGRSVPHPDRNAPNLDVAQMVTYDGCASDDTEGFLLSTADTANRLKSLKNDPAQVLVAAITGPAAPYTVTWKAPSSADTSCNTNGKSCPWPVIAHSCTAANGTFADPGVRTADFVNQFGSNGSVSSICDADFGPTMERLAAQLGGTIAGRCISDPIADDPSRAGYQPQCSAEIFLPNSQGVTTDQAVPSCADNGGTAPCWSLSTDDAGCQRPQVTLAAAPPSNASAHYECAVCIAGMVGQGCDDPGRTGDRVGRSQMFGNPCDVGTTVAGGPGGVTVTSVAPGCASRICLSPAADKDPGSTGALCTSSCTTNADCEGGILGNASDPSDHRCKTGFVCMVPTTVGDFCCQSMCVCRDYVVEPVAGFKTPAVCMGAMAGTCGNR
jgi:hypothetical protein